LVNGVSVKMSECLGRVSKAFAESLIEIAMFRDQQDDEHYSEELLPLLATYQNMLNGGDAPFLWESWQRLGFLRGEAVEQGLLAE
jgi:hypothetical protein